MKTRRRCPVCLHDESDNIKQFTLELPDQYQFLPDSFNVVRCTNCSMVFNDTPATHDDMMRYYDHPSHRPTREYRDEEKRLTVVADRITSLGLDIRSIGEVGPGDGQLGKLLIDRGFDYREDFSVDLIIINAVLEHVISPLDLISHLRKTARYIYIDVPSGTRDQVFNLEHVNHFEMSHLERLLGIPIQSGEDAWEPRPGWKTHSIWGLWKLSQRAYIRGFGQRAWIKIPELVGIDIAGVIDMVPRGLTFRGSPVMTPDEPLETGVPVLVCVDSPSLAREIALEYPDREVRIV